MSRGPEHISDRLDTSNMLAVGREMATGKIVINHLCAILRPEDALNMAAWIVALVDPKHERFNQLLESIENS